eukprot:350090-Chlamydomonas_euryale.AAC.2
MRAAGCGPAVATDAAHDVWARARRLQVHGARGLGCRSSVPCPAAAARAWRAGPWVPPCSALPCCSRKQQAARFQIRLSRISGRAGRCRRSKRSTSVLERRVQQCCKGMRWMSAKSRAGTHAHAHMHERKGARQRKAGGIERGRGTQWRGGRKRGRGRHRKDEAEEGRWERTGRRQTKEGGAEKGKRQRKDAARAKVERQRGQRDSKSAEVVKGQRKREGELGRRGNAAPNQACVRSHLQAPHPHGVVVGARCEEAPVRRDRNVVDRVGMAAA